VTNRDQKFPRWAGPLIGAIIGIVLGVRGMRREGQLDWIYPVAGFLLGALAGSVLWLLDAPPAKRRRRSSVAGSVLAALAIFPGILPVLGLLFGVPAFLINRRVSGWQNTASRLGLGLCVVLTVVVIVASQVPLK